KGSRLFPVTKVVPKPLLPLGNRMTLEYAFDALKAIEATDIALVVGDNEPEMRTALGDGSAFGVALTYVRQSSPQGLAHAVGFARDFVADDPFCLYLGDAIYSDSLVPFRDQFVATGADNLNLVMPVPDPERFGVAEVEGDRLTRLVEKPKVPRSNLAMAGVYFFGQAIWGAMEGLEPSARGEYEITDAIGRLIASGGDVRAGVYKGTWFDTGTLASFLGTNRWLLGGTNQMDPSALVEGAVDTNVAVGANARVICRQITDSVILPGADIQVKGEIRGSILGGCVRDGNTVANQILYGTLPT
ncbi:MAG: glucose-1-phosphate thymidylyltransferase, partial [Armatimonadota bacterium]